jgi:Zn-dependent protease with chaperone function
MSTPVPESAAMPTLDVFRLASEARLRDDIESAYAPRIADFTRAAKEVDEFEDAEAPPGERQFFLAEGIRMSPAVAPRLYELAHTALAHLHIDREVEFYIYRTDNPDAFCSYDRDRGIFSVCVAPEYINILEELELLDLLGHEIGHAVLDHVQNKYLMAEDLYLDLEDWERNMSYSVLGKHEKRQLQKAREALEILTPAFLARCRRLARLQELSADRIGLLCSRDLGASLISHMKELTSGLSSRFVRYDAAAIINQLDELDALDKHSIDLFDGTHPLTAVRMKSLMIFDQSETYAGFIGRPAFEHRAEEADRLVDELLRKTERFPFRQSDRSLIAAVAAGALYVLDAPRVTDEHYASLESGLYTLLEYSEIPSDWVQVDATAVFPVARKAGGDLARTMTTEEREDVLRMALELAQMIGRPAPRSRSRMHALAETLELPTRAADTAIHELRRRPFPERRHGTRRRP